MKYTAIPEMADEIIEMNQEGVDLGDDPSYDNIEAGDYDGMGFPDQGVDGIYEPEPPIIEDEKRKQLLKNLITKAKTGRLNKYLGNIDGSVQGLTEADLEARWAEIKTTLGAIRGNVVSTMGLTIIVNMIEFAGKAFDKPGASDHFALAAMNDEEILDTFAEIELELMENSQLAMQLKPKVRFCLRLFICYQKNRAKNLNLGAKGASESLMGRVNGL